MCSSDLGGAAPGVGVIEIGAGIGVLTAELARRAEKVVCVEIDSRLLPILDETLGEFTNVTILNEDVMKVDLADLIRREFPGLPVVVCANLPYYITSPILMSLLEQRLPIRSITVMVQREAARRICAQPGTREAGAISAAVRYYSEPGILFPVSRGSFLPAPEVDSSVIRLDVLPAPRCCGGGRGPVLHCGPGRLWTAAQNRAEHPFRRPGPCQGGDPAHSGGGRSLPRRPGRGADSAPIRGHCQPGKTEPGSIRIPRLAHCRTGDFYDRWEISASTPCR